MLHVFQANHYLKMPGAAAQESTDHMMHAYYNFRVVNAFWWTGGNIISMCVVGFTKQATERAPGGEKGGGREPRALRRCGRVASGSNTASATRQYQTFL